MCSTPRPKRRSTGKAKLSGSLLSNINSDARASFAQRANVADERRYQLKQEKALHVQQSNIVSLSKTNAHSISANKKRDWRYWLTSASFIELIFFILFDSVKNHHRK